MRERVNKTKKLIIPTILILLGLGLYEEITIKNESEISDIILDKLLFPIIFLSIIMSAYWIMLTEEFWHIYYKLDKKFSSKLKTGLKFTIWIPGMFLYFYIVIQGTLSLYNRVIGEQKLTNIHGQIINKEQFTSSGNTRCYFGIRDYNFDRDITLEVDRLDYMNLKIGDTYSTERTIGALGVIYKKNNRQLATAFS